MKKIHFHFPGAVNTVHQTGQALTAPSPGVNVDLMFADPDDTIPGGAEVYSDDQVEYAEIGLEWDQPEAGKYQLTGYDGVFELPREVIIAVEYIGLRVAADLKEDYGATVIAEEAAAARLGASEHAHAPVKLQMPAKGTVPAPAVKRLTLPPRKGKPVELRHTFIEHLALPGKCRKCGGAIDDAGHFPAK